jgi:uncharacterized protein YaeQ
MSEQVILPWQIFTKSRLKFTRPLCPSDSPPKVPASL